MDDLDRQNACLSMTRRECRKLGITRREWENARKASTQNKTPKPTKRGRPQHDLLTAFILDRARIEPTISMDKMALVCGCS